ncbi:hypothetical protein AHMF7605_11450 [Adhaeribacter arboris]|uniref:Uncharacterized protein n=1 Tax=Adhaeribacter arboris TaxID=2072846 RepID=A0A2T2YF12_9BACT|nr:hypothetical protein [Adhaeribacter arboris]PSR54092.1 hypothetical protein AHMF7605_11450 [Adhaeribacter arboris]
MGKKNQVFTIKKVNTLRLVFVLLLIFLTGCQSKHEPVEKVPNEQGRENESYVKALMTHYVAPSTRSKDLLPPPPLGYSYFTAGATYKGDTLRILLNTVKELVDLSVLAGESTDSVSIVSLVKGETLLELNEEAKNETKVIKRWASVDSIKSQGKNYTLNHYFSESGMQRKNLDFPEQAYLIDALSDWGLLVSWDDYIGTYRINSLK